MAILSGFLNRLAGKSGKTPQGLDIEQRYRDYFMKGDCYSVETEISEAIADLVLMGASFPVSGDSERAAWLDDVSDRFTRTDAKKAVTSAFVTGDCIVVPSWNGRNVQNMIVPGSAFDVFACAGEEITACGYVLDSMKKRGQEYRLMQSMELVPYSSADGSSSFECRYRTYVTKNGEVNSANLSEFPEWADRYTPEWSVPNVDRLLLGRFKSLAIDPMHVNNPKGVPICFGAGKYIEEIHYLLSQMHTEFGLSEKAVMAAKNMFQDIDENGQRYVDMPRGRKRLFMFTRGSVKGTDNESITEWAPDIRYQAYLDAIDKQEKLVERAVGVSSGIISTPNDISYENVDNVRKSQTKTMSFVSNARKQGEQMLSQLMYAWDVLANYYDITPMGEHVVSFDWSDEYIETFADKQNAILAGEAIGATDAVDYRMFLYGETPEAAAQRVAEIRADKAMDDEAGLSVPLKVQ